jgi:MYXO-CTERM domain-containing protein
LFSLDVTGDGTPEILLVTAGKIVAKDPYDRLIWETPPLGFQWIVGVEDLDGDGALDIVAAGSPGIVAVLRSRDGSLEWRTRIPTFGPSINAMLLPDVNGDGRSEVYAINSGCGIPGSDAVTGYAYSFGGGYGSGVEDSATRLWQIEPGRDYFCAHHDLVVDLTGDGHPDIVSFGHRYVYLIDGTTGQKVRSGDLAALDGFSLGTLAISPGYMFAAATETDGDAVPEVAVFSTRGMSPTDIAKAAFVLDYDAARPSAQRLQVVWSDVVADETTDTHTFAVDSATDLDRDGLAEVTSTFESGSAQETRVRRGRDGQLLVSIPGTVISGVYDLGSDRPRVLALQRGADLVGYAFASLAPGDAGLAAPLFVINGASFIGNVSFPDPDGTHRAIVVLASNGRLQLWSVASGTPMRLAEYDPGGASLTEIDPVVDGSGATRSLLVARDDGYVHVLDASLRVTNIGDAEIRYEPLRTGGYYTGSCTDDAPVATRFASGGDSVFVVDSQLALVRLEAGTATLVQPPRQSWRWPGATAAALLDADDDGVRDVIAITDARADSLHAIEARRGDGTSVIWHTDVTSPTSLEQLLPDVVSLAGTTGGTRFIVSTSDNGLGQRRAYGLSTTGMQLFVTDPVMYTSGGGLSVLDVDGDGRDDALLPMGPLRAVSGASGAMLATPGPWAAGVAIVTRGLPGAGTMDFVFSGGGSGAAAGYAITATGSSPAYAFSQRWTLPDSARPQVNCRGAIVQCADGARFATVQFSTAHFVAADVATGTIRLDTYLAGGALYASDADAAAAGALIGVLGNVTGTATLDAAQPAFLVGSTDGHLYALDACSTTPRLLWALDFRSPVGEAIFTDTDGDGEDEIVVSVADGYLYGIDTLRFEAPAWVREVDPAGADPDADVDDYVGSALTVRWAEVTGTTGYDYALFTAGGTPVTRNPSAPSDPFIRVGATVTSAEVLDGLTDGARYYFAVRAVGPAGSSVEALSDGVTFHRQSIGDAGVQDTGVTSDVVSQDAGLDARADAAGDGAAHDAGGAGSEGNCACTAAGATGTSRWWGWIAVAGLALARRRRRTMAR